MKSKPFSRRGLHRLECECGAYTYSTVANLESHGLPLCRCGGEHMPDRLELAMLLGLESAPVAQEYGAAVRSAQHGQASHGRRLRNVGRELQAPETIAAARIERRRAEAARDRRLNALKPAADPLPF